MGAGITSAPALVRTNDLNGDGFRHDGLVRHEEGEAAPVRLFEGAHHAGQGSDGDGDGRVGAVIAEVGAALGAYPVRRDALGEQFGAGFGLQRRKRGGQPGEQFRRQRCLHRRLAHRDDVREPEPVCGEHPGEGMDEHPGHAEGIGHGAGVLAARAPEGGKHVPGDVVPALYGDLLDRVGHVLHGDLEEPGGDLLGAPLAAGRLLDLPAQRRE